MTTTRRATLYSKVQKLNGLAPTPSWDILEKGFKTSQELRKAALRVVGCQGVEV